MRTDWKYAILEVSPITRGTHWLIRDSRVEVEKPSSMIRAMTPRKSFTRAPLLTSPQKPQWCTVLTSEWRNFVSSARFPSLHCTHKKLSGVKMAHGNRVLQPQMCRLDTEMKKSLEALLVLMTSMIIAHRHALLAGGLYCVLPIITCSRTRPWFKQP